MNAAGMTAERCEALERSEIEAMKDRMAAIRERPGNPEGVEVETFGDAVALYAKTMPWPQFNAVKGISEREVPLLDEIIRFYDDRGRPPQFEITPGNGTRALFRALHDRGYAQSGFHATLYRSMSHDDDSGGGRTESVRVRELQVADATLYATIHCRGTGLGDDGIDPVRRNNEVLMRREGWRFFAAEAEEEDPAAVGVMFMKDRTASLTFATTLPAYRGRGLQSALLRERIAVAVATGCELIVGQAAFASQSYRNMERAGMTLGYTRATWTKM
jgi:GNAT superfamily N-acetyltransferase